MKIDFHAAYKDVASLLNSKLKISEPKDLVKSFGALLRDIAPERPKEPKNGPSIEPSVVIPKAESEQSQLGPMARLNFTPPEIALPKPELAPNSQQIIELDQPLPSVKTPTLLDARRIAPPDRLADLSRSERMGEVKKILLEAGEKHGIDPALGMAVVSAESGFDPNAISTDGHRSKGLFQLLDSTGLHMHGKNSVSAPYNPFNPSQNVELGVGYLRHLHDIFSTPSALENDATTVPAANSTSLEKLAVAAFNAGEGRVAAAQERSKANGRDPSDYDQVASYLPDSTREYVSRVIRLRDEFEVDFDQEKVTSS